MPPVPNIQPCGHKPDQERIAYPEALREALERYHDDSATSDLLLLMAWENRPTSNLGTVLRIAQIRRANPVWRQNYPPAETDAGTRRDRAPSGRLDDSEAEVLRGATDAFQRMLRVLRCALLAGAPFGLRMRVARV